MAEFDTISKHFIHTYPADFVRFALQRDDIEVVEVLDTEQPTVEVRRTDSLLRIRIAGEDALVHHEFQTTDHPAMPRRMAGYIGRSIEHYGLPVYAHVLYLRPASGRRDPGYYIQEHPDYPVVIRLQSDPPEPARRSCRARPRVCGLAALCAVDAAASRSDRGGVVRAVCGTGGSPAAGSVGQGRFSRRAGDFEWVGV